MEKPLAPCYSSKIIVLLKKRLKVLTMITVTLVKPELHFSILFPREVEEEVSRRLRFRGLFWIPFTIPLGYIF